MSRKTAKIPVEFFSGMSKAQLLERLDEKLNEQKGEQLYKQKGKPVFVWGRSGDEITLQYYRNYRKDMCDTAFRGVFKEEPTGCNLEGCYCKPKGIWVIFWLLAAVFLIIFTAAPIILAQSPDIPLYYALPAMTFIAVAVYILVSLLKFDKKQLKIMNDCLREFTEAKNADILGEELEEELGRRNYERN